MARCQDCNRKLKDGTKTHCGGSKCKATAEQILPLCIKCNGLPISGRICPATSGQHIVAEEEETITEAVANKRI